MKFGDFVKVKSFNNPAGFKENLHRLGLEMPRYELLATMGLILNYLPATGLE